LCAPEHPHLCHTLAPRPKPVVLCACRPMCLCRVRADNAERINTFIALQFLFDHFWKQLKVRWRH